MDKAFLLQGAPGDVDICASTPYVGESIWSDSVDW